MCSTLYIYIYILYIYIYYIYIIYIYIYIYIYYPTQPNDFLIACLVFSIILESNFLADYVLALVIS